MVGGPPEERPNRVHLFRVQLERARPGRSPWWRTQQRTFNAIHGRWLETVLRHSSSGAKAGRQLRAVTPHAVVSPSPPWTICNSMASPGPFRPGSGTPRAVETGHRVRPRLRCMQPDARTVTHADCVVTPQQTLNFRPLPQLHRSLRPCLSGARTGVSSRPPRDCLIMTVECSRRHGTLQCFMNSAGGNSASAST